MYLTGETIEATVTLNQAVTLDGPSPVLLLQIGDNQREMTYVTSESTGTSWVFRYTVVADDRDDERHVVRSLRTSWLRGRGLI